jgi:hypothetical protein
VSFSLNNSKSKGIQILYISSEMKIIISEHFIVSNGVNNGTSFKFFEWLGIIFIICHHLHR